jgi:methylphosphotriester-DNA--protein-cysteine methyltransferase
MIRHTEIGDKELRRSIKNKTILLGGNLKLKIYGSLSCRSGKRMKKENRVFFISEEQAKENGFRPCGHCMKTKYQEWTCSIMS